MVRHSGFLALTLLVIAALTITARVGRSQTSDSDLRRVVQEWTSRCSSKEETQDPVASQCWLNAASALTRYTDGNSEPLVREVEQLQADWLERAAQLQAPTTARVEANKSPPADTAGVVQGPRRPSRILPNRTPSLDERVGAAVVAERPVTEPKVKRLVGTEKSLAKRSQNQTSKATKKRKAKISTAPQQITSSQSKSKTKSTTHTLKDGGQEKERGLACTNLKCIIKKRREQRAPAS
jgi:hypothetical protein